MDCPVIEDIIHEEDRFAMMIDGANLYQAARALGFDIDYRLLLETFSRCGRLVRVSFEEADPFARALDHSVTRVRLHVLRAAARAGG